VNIDFLIAGDRVTQFLTENLKAKIALLNKVLNKDDSKTVLSRREEHPEWFENLETNYTTKVRLINRNSLKIFSLNLNIILTISIYSERHLLNNVLDICTHVT